ncbi:hypothetical protein ACLB2K_047628 [Fragaria x ananassa]
MRASATALFLALLIMIFVASSTSISIHSSSAAAMEVSSSVPEELTSMAAADDEWIEMEVEDATKIMINKARNKAVAEALMFNCTSLLL